MFWNNMISFTIQDIDGAYFGTTFPHLFLMTYGHLKPQKPAQSYVPRVFGFKIHKPWDRSSCCMKLSSQKIGPAVVLILLP